MKELSHKIKTEESVKQQKQKQQELHSVLRPHNGHKVWEINRHTLEVKQAKFSNLTHMAFVRNKKEIQRNPDCEYIPALNAKSALKKFHAGKNGNRY